jgi:hypothetical protein
MERVSNLFTVLKKLKECVGFFFFNNLIATNGGALAKNLCFHKNKKGKGFLTNAMLNADKN